MIYSAPAAYVAGAVFVTTICDRGSPPALRHQRNAGRHFFYGVKRVMDVKVIIAMHKPYSVPMDVMYVPVHVGSYGKKSFVNPADSRECISDSWGDHISQKNPFY